MILRLALTTFMSASMVSVIPAADDAPTEEQQRLKEEDCPTLVQPRSFELQPGEGNLSRLLKQRYNAAQDALRERYNFWLQGIGTLDQVYAAAQRAIEARLDVVDPAADHLTILREKIEFAEYVERQTGDMRRSARQAIDEAYSRYFRLDAEIELLRAGVEQTAERAADQRMHSMDNLKQIALAMHNYHDVHQTLPPAYRAENGGRPLLSWRVLILPYINQRGLYVEFHLDEPWDSEHNKKLIERIPAVYRSAGSKAAAGATNYLTFRGADTVFPGKDGVSFRQITDGMSNTILVVEVSDKKAVLWTRPDDFEYNAADPQAGLVGLRSQGFLTAICDMSVRLIPPSIDKETLTRLILRNDGKPAPTEF